MFDFKIETRFLYEPTLSKLNVNLICPEREREREERERERETLVVISGADNVI